MFDRGILANFNHARQYLINFAKLHFPASAVNAESGKEIGISRKGLDKFLSGNILYEKYASGFHIPELIERAHKTAIAENYHPETRGSIPAFEYYDSPIVIDKKLYTAHIRVKNTNVGDKYYGHTVSEVDDIKIEPPTRTSAEADQPEKTGGSIGSFNAAENSLAGAAPAASSETPSPVEGTRPLNLDLTIAQGADPVNSGAMNAQGVLPQSFIKNSIFKAGRYDILPKLTKPVPGQKTAPRKEATKKQAYVQTVSFDDPQSSDGKGADMVATHKTVSTNKLK